MKILEQFPKRSYERPEAKISSIYSPKLLSVFSPTEAELEDWEDIGELGAGEGDY